MVSVFINELEEMMEYTLIKFTDLTEVGDSQHTSGQSCHSVKPTQTGGMESSARIDAKTSTWREATLFKVSDWRGVLQKRPWGSWHTVSLT